MDTHRNLRSSVACQDRRGIRMALAVMGVAQASQDAEAGEVTLQIKGFGREERFPMHLVGNPAGGG